MQVKFKEMGLDLEIKSKGIELGVADTKGKHLGDLWVTSTTLIWCNGRTTRENGKRIEWSEFMELMNQR